MEYLTIKEICKKWGLGSRIVTVYCTDGRISGVIKKGNLWLIPENALKPEDRRRKKTLAARATADEAFDKKILKSNEVEESNIVSLFESLNDDEVILSRIIEFFPYPIHVYSPDGMMRLTNEACLKVMHIPSKDHLVGKFNVLTDPIIDKWGKEVRDQIARSFQGEVVHFHNINMPIREIIDRFETDELCFDRCYQNIICYPIYDNQDRLAYVVHVFITSKLYDGKEEMVKAKEYIEVHWMEEFDLDELSSIVNLSKYHFSRLFKRHTGITPYSYYQDVKIRKIKESLCDKNISVAQAFANCGVDYNSTFSRIFKAKVGMTPSEYRASLE